MKFPCFSEDIYFKNLYIISFVCCDLCKSEVKNLNSFLDVLSFKSLYIDNAAYIPSAIPFLVKFESIIFLIS